ncbi:MAG: hypothetical protein LBJ00_12920 [Planctomycetaceae bacterium]|jgi:hypothetical protein|nr:hypothetical protein [Planctomycetaceae bacterium]
MKCLLKNWKIGAYFGSIVLAVGIGMVHTTTGGNVSGGIPCNYRMSDQPSCRSMTANKDDNPALCTGSFFNFYATPGLQNTKLFLTLENASACSKCTMKSAVSYDAGACGGGGE